MAANWVPGELDWVVIPDVSFNDPMDVDPHLDEWEDIPEEDLGNEGQTVSERVMQTIIMCVSVAFPVVMYL